MFEKSREFLRNPNKHEISALLNEIESNRYDLEKLLSKLFKIKRKTVIIDLFELERLILKANISKDKIKNKDIIVVMGQTGAGKTTTILKFLGNSFEEVYIRGAKKYAPFNLSPSHYSFHTSFEAISCTSFINAAQIPESMASKIKLKKT